MSRTAFAFAALALAVCAEDPKPAEKPFATRDGRKVSVQPAGPAFEIPEGWVEWQDKFKTALHVTRPEIEAVREGAGEWDTEFAEVVNAVLDFDTCAFAGGGEGWGKDAVAFSDLQMRLYVVSGEPEAVEKRIDAEGAKAVRTIMSPERVDRRNRAEREPGGEEKPRPPQKEAPLDKFRPTRDAPGDWRKSLFAFEMFYGDYGATAYVDFRLRKFGGKTVAAVFMYTNFKDQGPTIQAILDSVAWPDAPK